MYFKSITLRGFLCYKDATTIHFDPRFNIIVGPNGSGKSSLLAGIRFVMGGISVDIERCLHRGASSRVLVGYVSVVLDNSDGRLTGFDATEITLRRDFGQKKDGFTLNGKKILKQELQNLLESAGFSRTNPYYFVHQHEVAALTRMSNPERLQLLKEVAGTRVYDERRAESVATLEETRNRRRDIDGTLAMITQRMDELQEEQQELREFVELEKEKRCIEILLGSKQLEQISDVVATLETSCEKHDDNLFEKTTELGKITELAEKLDTEYQADQSDLNRYTSLQLEVRKKVTEAERETTRLSLLIEAKQKQSAKRKKTQMEKELQLKKLKSELEKLENDLRGLLVNRQTAESCSRREELELLNARQEITQLQSRTNRTEQFTSVTERNKALSKAVKKKEDELKTLIKSKNDAQQELSQLNTSHKECPRLSRELVEELERLETRLRILSEQINQSNTEIAELQDRRSKLQQEDINIHRSEYEKDNEMHQALRRLNGTIRLEQQSANAAAHKWAKETNNEQVIFGTLIENIQVDERYFTAIETAGGIQLFNLLVLNRRVAIDVIEYIKRHRQGATTLTPLEDISDRQSILSLPSRNESRVKLLTDVIECRPEVLPAVRQVFGRFLLVQDRDVGNEYKTHGWDSITLEGDMISRKGIIKGGYLGHQIRMACQLRINKIKDELEGMRIRKKDIEHELDQIAQTYNKFKDSNRHNEIERDRLRMKKSEINERIQDFDKSTSKYESQNIRLINQISEFEGQMNLIKEDIQRIRREIALPTLGELTKEESKRVAELGPVIASLEAQNKAKKVEVEEVIQQSKTKEFELNEVLRPQIMALTKEIQDLSDDSCNSDGYENEELESKQTQLMKQLKNLKIELGEIDTHRSSLTSSVSSKKQQLAQLKTKDDKLRRKIEDLSAELQTVKTRLEEQRIHRDELLRKQQAMPGSSELLNKLSKQSGNELTKKLAILTKKLRSFDDVNRKASDQYSSFIREQDNLVLHRDHLYHEEDSVIDLMREMDDQKDSTLLKTFENVNEQFRKVSRVFSEIVPGGKAQLVLKKLPDEEIARLRSGATSELALPDSTPSSFDIWTGVGVKIQFPSFKGYIPLESLSGGQKSVAALSLMFALQRVDPAPFYVLDEIDASLDTQYRGAVAKLIQTQSRTSQIIVISHKAQTIQLADRFLKTFIVNQTTGVVATTKEDALLISQRMTVEDQENVNQGDSTLRPPT